MSQDKTKTVRTGETAGSFISCEKGETARIQLGDGNARAVHVIVTTAGGTEIVVPARILGELRITPGLDLVPPHIRIHVESDTPELRIVETGSVHALQVAAFKRAAHARRGARLARARARKPNA